MFRSGRAAFRLVECGTAGVAVALNGSGLGVTVQTFGVNGNTLSNFVDVGERGRRQLPSRFNVPAQLTSRSAAARPFVARRTGGLQVVKYAHRCAARRRRSTIKTTPADAEANTPGLQLVEGQRATLGHRRDRRCPGARVELLVNGHRWLTTSPIRGISPRCCQTIAGNGGSNQVTLQVVPPTPAEISRHRPDRPTLIPDRRPSRLSDTNARDGAIPRRPNPTIALLFSRRWTRTDHGGEFRG